MALLVPIAWFVLSTPAMNEAIRPDGSLEMCSLIIRLPSFLRLWEKNNPNVYFEYKISCSEIVSTVFWGVGRKDKCSGEKN